MEIRALDRKKGTTGLKDQEDDLPALLLPGEVEELATCERIIERGMETFFEVGLALAKIRERRLYRASFDTWEGYCQERWGFTARRARQLLQAADTVRSLGLEAEKRNPGSAFAMPACEKHVRPLYDLPEEERLAAWAEAVSTAPKGFVTRKHVADVVKERRIRLGLEERGAGSGERGANGESNIAKPDGNLSPAVNGARGVHSWVPREERLRAASARAIADVRELVEMAGTADSGKTADLRLALEQLESFHEHLRNLQNMQQSRTQINRRDAKSAEEEGAAV